MVFSKSELLSSHVTGDSNVSQCLPDLFSRNEYLILVLIMKILPCCMLKVLGEKGLRKSRNKDNILL